MREAELPLRPAGRSGARPLVVRPTSGREHDEAAVHSRRGSGGDPTADRRVPATSGTHPGTDRGQRHDLPVATAARHPGAEGQKRGLQATVTAESAAEVERLIGAGPLDGIDFEAVETAARQMALRIMGRAVAQRLDADHSEETGSVDCDCGTEARYAGRRPKTPPPSALSLSTAPGITATAAPRASLPATALSGSPPPPSLPPRSA